MAKLFHLFFLMSALFAGANVYGDELAIENGWSRATAPGQDAASVDMSITSKTAVKLVEATTPVANTVAIHKMTHADGMMTMREVEAIDIPAGKALHLGEAGYHLMLTGLKEPLKESEKFPVTLKFKMANGQMIEIKTMIEVKPLTGAKPMSHDHGSMHMSM